MKLYALHHTQTKSLVKVDNDYAFVNPNMTGMRPLVFCSSEEANKCLNNFISSFNGDDIIWEKGEGGESIPEYDLSVVTFLLKGE